MTDSLKKVGLRVLLSGGFYQRGKEVFSIGKDYFIVSFVYSGSVVVKIMERLD